MDAARIMAGLRRLASRPASSLDDLCAPIGAWADRHGLGPMLLRLVSHAPPDDARLAALALRAVSSEFVRRAVVRSAMAPDEPRRAVLRVACRRDEVPQDPAAEPAEVAALAGLLATAPALFAEWLAETRAEFTLALVEVIEAQRAGLGLEAATTWAPVLARRCTPDARERIHQLLGRSAGPRAQALLDAEERRAPTEESARSARRERMRQSMLAAADEPREGFATWTLGPRAEAESFRLHERLASGETLRTSIQLIGSDAVEWWSEPVARAGEDDPLATRLSLGAARTLVEGMGAGARKRLAPLVARLEALDAEPLPRAVPGAALEPGVARALVSEAPFAAWRPLEAMHGWSPELLASGRDDPREAWPPRVESVAALAQGRLETHVAEAASSAAHRLHRFSALLRLRGDARAEGVAGEAVLAARGRATPVLVAWAEAELARRLPWQAPLPLEYRAELRALLRARVGAGLDALRTLDLAQAALEAMAREQAARPGWPGLPAPAEMPVDRALAVGTRLAALLARRDRAWSVDELAYELGLHEPLAEPVLRALAEFAVRGCLRECPRRCFTRPAGELEAHLDGDSPVTVDPLDDPPKRRVRRSS